MSLLQDVLRTQTLDSLDKALASGRNSPDDDDELVNVVSTHFYPRRNGGVVLQIPRTPCPLPDVSSG